MSLSSSSGSLSGSDISHLSSLLDSMRLKVQTNRIHVPSFFHDWDRARTGAISKPQFARCLVNIGFKLSHESVELLSRVYSLASDNSKASYRAYIADLESEGKFSFSSQPSEESADRDNSLNSSTSLNRSGEFGRSLGGSHRNLTGSELTYQNLIQKLQTIVKRQRKHINDLFDDFDPLRKRRVSAQQFRRCLDVAGFGLSEEEFQLLRESFADREDENMVKFDDLIREVTNAFVPLSIERNPTLTPTEFQPVDSSISPSAGVADLVAHFGYLTHTRRILLKPSFQHFDKANHGEISSSQFQSVISSLFPMRLEPAEMNEISSAYQSDLNVGLVNYAKFVADVTNAEQEYDKTYLSRAVNLTATQPIQPTERNFNGSITVPAFVNIQPQVVPQRDLNSLISYLRDFCGKQRIINIETIFYDFDPLRHGFVSAPRFHRALLMAGLKISQTEADLLSSEFRSYKEDNAVDYVKFSAELCTVPNI